MVSRCREGRVEGGEENRYWREGRREVSAWGKTHKPDYSTGNWNPHPTLSFCLPSTHELCLPPTPYMLTTHTLCLPTTLSAYNPHPLLTTYTLCVYHPHLPPIPPPPTSSSGHPYPSYTILHHYTCLGKVCCLTLAFTHSCQHCVQPTLTHTSYLN